MYIYIYIIYVHDVHLHVRLKKFGPGAVDLRDPGQDILTTARPRMFNDDRNPLKNQLIGSYLSSIS